MSLGDLTLLRPGWLVCLPLLALAAALLARRGRALGDWSRVADGGLLQAMERLGHVDARARVASGLGPALLAVLVIVVALSGPARERRDAVSFRNLDGVILVVDASPAMTEDKDWPQMLTLGRFALAALGSRPAALIVYAGDAYMASDLTLDHLELGQTLSLLDAQTVPDPGARPARALAMAAERLSQADVLAGDVVLFTSGAGLGAPSLVEAERIAALGARLSVVSRKALGAQALARVGGGAAFGLSDVDALAAFLAEEGRTRLEAQDYPLLFWHDWGRYLLILALLPVALMFRRAGP